jgi:hypothetical protein
VGSASEARTKKAIYEGILPKKLGAMAPIVNGKKNSFGHKKADTGARILYPNRKPLFRFEAKGAVPGGQGIMKNGRAPCFRRLP